MTCRELQPRLVAYADDELGVEAAIELEAHLARCPACRDACDRQRTLRAAVAQLYPRESMPDAARAALRAKLRPGPWRRAAPFALALVASLLVVLGLRAWQAGGPRDGRSAAVPAVTAALRLHAAAEHARPALAVTSANVGDVNRWLARELPFATPLPRGAASTGPAGAALRLEGAAVADLDGEDAAWILYRQGDEPVSLFVLPPRAWPAIGQRIRHRDVEFHSFEAGPHRVVAWNHGAVSYLLVSPAAAGRGDACATCHLGPHLPPVAGFATARGS